MKASERMRKIYTYEHEGECPVSHFFDNTNDKITNKLKYQLRYIKDEKNVFSEPHIKHFSIEKYRRLYELRIKATGVMVRVIFYERNGEIILLHAFYKRDRKDTEKALETALKILNSILDENGDIKAEFKKELV